jgi:hypothetical protein
MICYSCGKGEEAGPFKKSSQKNAKKGYHKRCHAIYCWNRQIIKQAEICPDRFMQCDDCDHMFGIRGGRYKPLRTACPKCNSEEIMTFAEQQGKGRRNAFNK